MTTVVSLGLIALGMAWLSPVQAASPTNHAAAKQLIQRSIGVHAGGQAFNAKVRQRVWVGGREVVGVGSYEQAGQHSGRFNLQVTMHDGDGKHSLQQISDGRLMWTRQQIGDQVSLRRIDVGRLDQWIKPGTRDSNLTLPPSSLIGAWTELMHSLTQDYRLALAPGSIEQSDGRKRRVWIVQGVLSDQARSQILKEIGQSALPELLPTRAVLAIARDNDPETNFGSGLMLRLEFRAEPVADAEGNVGEWGPLISLIEMHSPRPIMAPPIGRFRFENQDADVHFVNETDRYLDQFDIQLSHRETRVLRR
ncbi:MAG: hypothetical protein AAF539_02695 [Planctomycetota bacterium]